eukprot:5144560-Amphidinium_carterae.2
MTQCSMTVERLHETSSNCPAFQGCVFCAFRLSATLQALRLVKSQWNHYPRQEEPTPLKQNFAIEATGRV